jgi:carboxymethylenebutenolidase
VLLYGSRGLTTNGEAFRAYAHSLAEHGYVAYLPRYFDATGSETAGALPVPPERFRTWTRAVEDAIGHAARDPQVDARRIGLLGMSLGGFLAAWEASQDTRVRALAEYYGGASMFLGAPKRMPATLIVHGEKDSFVPVEQARQLQRLVEQQQAPCEIKIYPGQEHGFNFDGDPAAARDAWEHTLDFFRRHLR